MTAENYMSMSLVNLLFILSPILIASIAAIPPLFMGMYNFSGVYTCSLASYPLGCNEMSNVQCIRGTDSKAYASWSIISCCFIGFVIALLFFDASYSGHLPKDSQAKGRNNNHRINVFRTQGRFLNYVFITAVVFFTVVCVKCISASDQVYFAIYDIVNTKTILFLVSYFESVIIIPFGGFINCLAYFCIDGHFVQRVTINDASSRLNSIGSNRAHLELEKVGEVDCALTLI